MEASAAHFGNIQLYDRSHHALRIAAQQGFGKEFLQFFSVVSGNEYACGSAMAHLSRVVVADVSSDPIFDDATSRAIMLRAQAHAVQSTPLISSSGQFFGIISTHYRQPRTFARRELEKLDKLGRKFAGKIEEHLDFQLSLP
jgi:GAF domain-containing protein